MGGIIAMDGVTAGALGRGGGRCEADDTESVLA